MSFEEIYFQFRDSPKSMLNTDCNGLNIVEDQLLGIEEMEFDNN